MSLFPPASWQCALIHKIGRHPKHAGQLQGHVATPITQCLYLSDAFTACTRGNLENLGVTHVVSAFEANLSTVFGEDIAVMHVPVKDNSDADISKWFDAVVEFIQEALDIDEKNKVLVHCTQGISRSPILVCAYLVATTPMCALEAIEFVQAKRHVISPNLAFRRQLVQWSEQFDEKGKLCKFTTVQWLT
ncbi:protein-tyrosine phosphatase-like protein [Pisolithus albus]|nr:protein-tyrosine phosphatase-like protein [Pisolithus albus]